jgi:hypothetical protein
MIHSILWVYNIILTTSNIINHMADIRLHFENYSRVGIARGKVTWVACKVYSLSIGSHDKLPKKVMELGFCFGLGASVRKNS